MSIVPEMIMSSYATYKELCRCERYKSPYDILGEFVKFIICEDKTYQFTSIEIKKKISDMFGFTLPNAVIKSTLKKLNCLEKMQETDTYSVNNKLVKLDPSFEIYRKTAQNDSNELIDKLIGFIESQQEKELDSQEKKKVSIDFMAYLLDKTNGNHYQNAISEFILNCSKNEKDYARLQDIREGCILYTGINYSITEVGSVTKDLVLFLDMEVLFDLYGYNGEVFEGLANDLINLIAEANSKRKHIFLKYFEETKNEIDDFFLKAEDIVNDKTVLQENVAMKAIVDKCNDETDIIDKQTDFFHKLQYTYGITQDEKLDYYNREDYCANLEEETKERKKDLSLEQSVRYISNINKLRNDKLYTDYFDTGYIFITETRKTLDVSLDMIEKINPTEEKKYAGYAINMSFITNMLWYKINKGFGTNSFPRNIDAVIKAKIVLSNFISNNIVNVYDECKKEYNEGKIDCDMFSARLLALRERHVRPEDITLESYEDDLDFSPEKIKRFEEEHNWQKVQLEEKEEKIQSLEKKEEERKRELDATSKTLEAASNENRKRENVISKQEKTIDEQNCLLKKQNYVIKQLKEEDERKKRRREKFRKIILFVFHILLEAGGIILIALISYFITLRINADIAGDVSFFLSIISGTIMIVDIVKRIYKKDFGNDVN